MISLNMGRDLRCDPAFLRQQQMRDGVAHFACYVRGMNLDHPFSIRISPKNIEREPQMTEDWYQSTRGWNSCNVCYQEAINENWTEEEWDEYERMQSPLEASSRPVTEATGVAPIITHEGPTKAEPSARPHAQSPRRSAHTESLPPQDTDENKPAPWKRG